MNMSWPSPEQRSRDPRSVTPIVNATAVTASTCGSVAVAAMASMTVESDAPCAALAAAPPGGAANGGAMDAGSPNGRLANGASGVAVDDASPNGRLANGPSGTPGPG